MALVVAGLLTLAVLVMALVVDLGYAWVVRAQLQNAADAAAHAGVAELDGTSGGLAAARAAAMAWAKQNYAAGHEVVLEPEDVKFGAWDEGAGRFVESSDALLVDTVRVSAHGESPGFFAPLAFGIETFDATARTTVQGGGVGDVGCYLPLAIPSCLVEYNPGGVCDVTLTFHPATEKNVAWARIDGSARPNAAWLREQITTCTDAGARVGEEMQLDNGTVMSALADLRDKIEASAWSWPPRWGSIPARLPDSDIPAEEYGRIVSGPVAVFQSDDCAAGPYTGSATVIGFAQAAIYDVRTGANATLRAHIVCGEEVGAEPGGIAGTGFAAAPRFRQ